MLATTTRLRLALIAALCCIAVGVAFFVGSRHRGPPDTGAPTIDEKGMASMNSAMSPTDLLVGVTFTISPNN
jgi:hypothetical protein